MKTSLFLFLTFLPFYLLAQLIDIIPEDPTPSHYYYKNLGQIIDNQGSTREDIKFYTERSSPGLYMRDGEVSFVYFDYDTVDGNSTSRIDLKFICNGVGAPESESCGVIIESEETEDHLNYYLPHCPSGILNVPGYKRIEYQDAFPDIDVHFYSNSWGAKSYIVINPGADPDDILFLFEGQDSINSPVPGGLDLYLADDRLTFPQATAYQVNTSNQAVPISWLPVWNNLGSGYVSMSMGSYNANWPLIIRIGGPPLPTSSTTGNLDWSTYYGGTGLEDNNGGIVTDPNENIYTVTNIFDSSFPTLNGQQAFSGGGYDIYISLFDYGAERKWSTYYGGSSGDLAWDVAYSNRGYVYVTGRTFSSDLPMSSPNNGNFIQSTFGGNPGASEPDALIASFNNSNGHKYWTTYFGGNGIEESYSISISNPVNKLYICGVASPSSGTSTTCNPGTNGQFPLCQGTGNRYFQNAVAGINPDRDGFVAEFDLITHELLWSTYFGGEDDDEAREILAVSPSELSGAIFISGYTHTSKIPTNTNAPLSAPTNGAFPITSSGGNEYFQNVKSSGSYDGFIAKFDNNYQLVWSTYFGGEGEEIINSMATNSESDIYIVTSTTSTNTNSSCSANNNSSLPICNSNSNSYIQSSNESAGIALSHDYFI
jgi:hypothetical protein